jgi:type I restriction enzyme R protein
MANTTEKTFEDNIEAHLLTHGWSKVEQRTYDEKLGLFPEEVIAFVKQTQPKAWTKLVRLHDGEETARTKLLSRVANEIDRLGTISVLRNTSPTWESRSGCAVSNRPPVSMMNNSLVIRRIGWPLCVSCTTPSRIPKTRLTSPSSPTAYQWPLQS